MRVDNKCFQTCSERAMQHRHALFIDTRRVVTVVDRHRLAGFNHERHRKICRFDIAQVAHLERAFIAAGPGFIDGIVFENDQRIEERTAALTRPLLDICKRRVGVLCGSRVIALQLAQPRRGLAMR